MSFAKCDRVINKYKDSAQQIDIKGIVPYQTCILTPSKKSLEDEILNLRLKMEQAVWQEQSLTSESVIKLSSMLDHKINEYMKNKLKKKQIIE